MTNLAAVKTFRTVLVAQYFGELPGYFSTWLLSCGRNPDIQWVFVTDQPLDNHTIPTNVQVVHKELSDVKAVFEARFSRSIVLERPYKLCDFRPFFWMILDDLGLPYDYWGHCDIDMVFGHLRPFFQPAFDAGYERLFELGCLSVYRNSLLSKSIAFSTAAQPGWEQVIASDCSFGFDEHNGVNQSWAAFPELWYRQQHAILDIEPRILPLAAASGALMPPSLRVFWEEGHLFAVERLFGCRSRTRALMLIHFQKRPLQVPQSEKLLQGFEICPDTITALLPDGGRCLVSRQQLEIASLSISDRLFLARNRLRKSQIGSALHHLRRRRK